MLFLGNLGPPSHLCAVVLCTLMQCTSTHITVHALVHCVSFILNVTQNAKGQFTAQCCALQHKSCYALRLRYSKQPVQNKCLGQWGRLHCACSAAQHKTRSIVLHCCVCSTHALFRCIEMPFTLIGNAVQQSNLMCISMPCSILCSITVCK